MGVTVVFVLAMAALVSATIGDNTVGGKDQRESVEPVSAPQQDSTYHAVDSSQQVPILSLLTPKKTDNVQPEASAKSSETNPVYVETLEEQGKEHESLNRQKRHHIKQSYGGYGGKQGNQGGCGRCGGGGGYGGSMSSAVAFASAQSGGYGRK